MVATGLMLCTSMGNKFIMASGVPATARRSSGSTERRTSLYLNVLTVGGSWKSRRGKWNFDQFEANFDKIEAQLRNFGTTIWKFGTNTWKLPKTWSRSWASPVVWWLQEENRASQKRWKTLKKIKTMVLELDFDSFQKPLLSNNP